MLKLPLELRLCKAVTLSVADLVVLSDELTTDDEVGVTLNVCVSLLEPVTLSLQLRDMLAVSEVVCLWLALSDALWLKVPELTEAVGINDALADCDT